MSNELDKARQQLAAGRYRRAADTLWEVARWAQTDVAEAQGMIDVASAIATRTTGRTRDEAESLVRNGQNYLQKMTQPERFTLGFGRYLGGCRALGPPCEGRLSFARDGLHVDDLLLEAAAIASIWVRIEQTRHTNVGAVIGLAAISLPLGAVGLAMQDTVYHTEMTVALKSSESAGFVFEAAIDVRMLLGPLLRELGIPHGDASGLFYDPAVARTQELARLMDLLEKGAIGPAEFERLKGGLCRTV